MKCDRLLGLFLVAILVLAGNSVSHAEGWSWWPWGESKAKPARAAEPSAWGKMQLSTKRMLAKTKDVLTPGGSESSHVAVSQQRSYTSRRKKESSWFSSWFASNEPEGPRTVNEFLRQPRPEFGQ